MDAMVPFSFLEGLEVLKLYKNDIGDAGAKDRYLDQAVPLVLLGMVLCKSSSGNFYSRICPNMTGCPHVPTSFTVHQFFSNWALQISGLSTSLLQKRYEHERQLNDVQCK